VANKLVSALRASDTVSRQGGDEFVILLCSIDSHASAAETAKRILRALHEPHTIGEQTLVVSGSLGISIYPNDGKDTDTLLKHADIAMYEAKDRGRNNFQFFKTQMTEKAIERRSVENSLRHALERDEFVLHYQPKIELKTGRITGVEALIRWLRPVHGLVYPMTFVPIAEECGLIVGIGKWVLREACRQAQEWRRSGLAPSSVAVNVSALEFSDPNFVDGVRATLAESGLEPQYLEIELTEGVLMKDIPAAAAVLAELKSMGVRLTVDDFGTGYSSLSYLQEFPIDGLKIDRSFVRKISAEPDDSLIVDAIIKLSESLKLLVVAEGIETEEQRRYLLTLDCAEGQGFLFSRPVPADELTALLWESANSFA
jgi:predicted signal transduction protein with EAL and GGDEF domain